MMIDWLRKSAVKSQYRRSWVDCIGRMLVRPSNREIANQPVVAFVARPSAAEWDTLFLTTATSGLNNHGSRATC